MKTEPFHRIFLGGRKTLLSCQNLLLWGLVLMLGVTLRNYTLWNAMNTWFWNMRHELRELIPWKIGVGFYGTPCIYDFFVYFCNTVLINVKIKFFYFYLPQLVCGVSCSKMKMVTSHPSLELVDFCKTRKHPFHVTPKTSN